MMRLVARGVDREPLVNPKSPFLPLHGLDLRLVRRNENCDGSSLCSLAGYAFGARIANF